MAPGGGAYLGPGHWYNTLKWELEECRLESQSLHSNVIHTAFAIEHNAERFSIKVNVSGKLASKTGRLKNWKSKSGSKEQGIVTTMVEWQKDYRPLWVLDKLAESLPSAMQYENLANVSMKMPDALPPSFGPSTLTPATDIPAKPPCQVFQELDPSSPVGPLSRTQRLRGLPELEPTIESMELAAGLLETPLVETGRGLPYQQSKS